MGPWLLRRACDSPAYMATLARDRPDVQVAGSEGIGAVRGEAPTHQPIALYKAVGDQVLVL